jgi:hypothetical protein
MKEKNPKKKVHYVYVWAMLAHLTKYLNRYVFKTMIIIKNRKYIVEMYPKKKKTLVARIFLKSIIVYLVFD